MSFHQSPHQHNHRSVPLSFDRPSHTPHTRLLIYTCQVRSRHELADGRSHASAPPGPPPIRRRRRAGVRRPRRERQGHHAARGRQDLPGQDGQHGCQASRRREARGGGGHGAERHQECRGQLLGRPAAEARQGGRHGVAMVLLHAVGHVQGGHVDRRQEAPRAPNTAGQSRLLRRALPARAHGPLLPAAALEPRPPPRDGGGGAAHGRRRAAAPALAPPLRAQRRLDPGAHGGGRERAHAPHDLPGGDAAALVGARPRRRRPGRLLQRILRRLPRLPQVRAPLRGVPRGGGRALLHGIPQGPEGRNHREHAGPRHRHRLLAPPRRRHAQGRRHRRARRRGAPPRRQPLRIGHPLPGTEAQGGACADRIPLIYSNFNCQIGR